MRNYLLISRCLTLMMLIALFSSFQSNKELLPDPVVKIGSATVSGRIVNLKVPAGEKKVMLSFFVYNPITGNEGVTTYTTSLDSENKFSIQVPLECSTEICCFNIGNDSTLFGWGYVGLDQSKELKVNLVFDDNGRMRIDATGGLSLSADDILNIEKAIGIFEDCHTWGEFQTMSPKEFLDHELNISLKQRMSAALDTLVFTDKIRRYLTDDLTLRFYKGRVFYYKVVVKQCFEMNNMKDTGAIVEPDISYYSFLKPLKLNNPQYLYCEDFSNFIIRFLRIPAFKIPAIKDAPIEEWLSIVKKSISNVVGFSSGFFYDMLATKAYIYQIKVTRAPLSKQQLTNIQAYFKDNKKDIGKLLIASNNQLVKELNESLDLKINRTPMPINGDVVEGIVSNYKGSVVVVDLWATWCGPCMKAIGEMKPLKMELKPKGVVFVYVTNRSSPKELWSSTTKTIGGEHYYLENGEWEPMMERYKLQYIPSYLIFDKNGKLQQKITSFPGNEKMRTAIEALIH